MNNFNHFEQGGPLYITALRRIRELGAALHHAVSESSELRRSLANYENADANHRYTEFALRLNVDERDRALFESRQTVAVQALFIGSLRDTNTALRTGVSEHDRVVAGLQHTIAEQGGTIDDLRRTIAELQRANADHVRANSEQGDTIANLQRTIAALQHRDSVHVRTINGLQRTVTDLQHANAGHVQTIDELERANADQQSQLNEAHCTSAICLGGINYLMNRFAESEYGTEIHRQSLDAAIPPPDILADDYDSDVTDMVVDIPTAADTVATTSATSSVVASPVIDPQPGLPLPSFDLADTARHESSDAIYDQSGAEVTSERLLAVVKPFIYISPDVVLASYYDMYGFQLIPNGIKPHEFVKALAKLDGFGYLTLWLSSEHSARLAHLNFLQRCDLELETLRDDILGRLGLTKDLTTVVLGPVLCYTLVVLCGSRMDRMTGSILEQMFTTVTNIKLQSLWVVTADGANRMSAFELCHMVKVWVEGLGEFIAMDNGAQRSFDMARQCSHEYERRCVADGNNSKDKVAADMLRHNEHFSQLFLGVGEDKLTVLHRVLPHLMNRDTST
ncbi:hypothetical protein GGI24_001549 [Coemansia furcata]|nr:hypothetical protein GGI24_001549 [Coemansia furcata]